MSVEFCKTGEKTVLCASEVRRALVVAAAGRHNILLVGSPGCGKTRYANYMRLLTPIPTKEKLESASRIHSLAGIMPPEGLKEAPFRHPHQTATIGGMFGGGAELRPGEVSLAHNGILFLEDAAEFRASVLQVLRVPMETQSITLSRAGRSTVFPADFQLVMTANPCPCGNHGSEEKVCLCSARSVEMYWKKFSAPLLDRIEIIVCVGDDDEVSEFSLDGMREEVAVAVEAQRERQGKPNERLAPEEVAKFCDGLMDVTALALVHKKLSDRGKAIVKKVARTLADLDGTDAMGGEDVAEALRLYNFEFRSSKNEKA